MEKLEKMCKHAKQIRIHVPTVNALECGYSKKCVEQYKHGSGHVKVMLCVKYGFVPEITKDKYAKVYHND